MYTFERSVTIQKNTGNHFFNLVSAWKSRINQGTLRKRGKNQNNLLQQLNANKQVKSYFCIGNFMLEEIIFTKGE